VIEQRRDGVSVFSCNIDFGSSGSPVFVASGNGVEIVSVISARAEASDTPISLGMRLGGRVAALEAALDEGVSGVSGVSAGAPQGARSAARFVRP
jgi:hypothetical protein